jgi:glucose/mannose-6-phosphate isomerase
MLKDFTLWPQKLKDGLALSKDFHKEYGSQFRQKFTKIAFVGMGGSGIAGRIIKTFLDKKCNIPSFIIDSPEVPAFVDTETLTFVISYSGNTWEVNTALETLSEKFIPMIVISKGGKTAETAEAKNLPYILLPESMQPRSALGHFLGIILGILELLGIMVTEEIIKEFLKQSDLYIRKFTDDENYFKDFLYKINDYDFVHIWGVSSDSAAFAYRAQTQFNENSKIQAVSSIFPECCHNLLAGFTDCKEKCKIRPFVMFFNTEFLPTKLNSAVLATCEILKEEGVILYKPPVLGDNWEGQLFHMILWSDFASYYLGKHRGVEIAPVKLISKLKEKHSKMGIK